MHERWGKIADAWQPWMKSTCCDDAHASMKILIQLLGRIYRRFFSTEQLVNWQLDVSSKSSVECHISTPCKVLQWSEARVILRNLMKVLEDTINSNTNTLNTLSFIESPEHSRQFVFIGRKRQTWMTDPPLNQEGCKGCKSTQPHVMLVWLNDCYPITNSARKANPKIMTPPISGKVRISVSFFLE